MAGNESSRTTARKGSSGRGGPATYAGANFQTLIGVREAVALLGSLASHPWQGSTIAAEPRSFGENGQVGYDISLPGGRRRIEVKGAPTRADVREFAATVRDDPAGIDELTTFEFIHGQSSKAVADLTEVGRAAREAPDQAHFGELVARMSDEQRELVSRLGADGWRRARQIRSRYLPEAEARMRVEWVTDRMYGEGPAKAVRDRLAARFAAAAEHREAFAVVDLRDELAAAGGQVQIAPIPDLTGGSVWCSV
jgi:hypothetical protein